MLSPRGVTIRDGRYKWFVFAALAIGLFTSVADAGSTIVALPTIADHFDIDLPATQWVVVAYLLTITALLLPMGRVADIVGRKRVYVAGFTIFTAGAVFAGLSTDILMLVLSRVLMGIGSAMTQGPSMAMLISAFPGAERGKALGLQMSAVGTGGVAGPALGGVIVGVFGWRGVFFATASLGVLTILAGMLVLRSSQSAQNARMSSFDWVGAAMSAGIVVSFLLGMSNGPSVGWTSPFIFAAWAATVVLLIGFVWWELRTATPMLDVRLFRKGIFSIGVATRFIAFVGMSSVRYLMPFYVQSVMGYSPRFFGLIAIPAAVCTIVLGPLSGRLSDRYGWKKFVVGGLLLSAIGLFALASLSIESIIIIVIGAWVLQSIGTGVFGAPNSSSVLSTVERGSYGVVASSLNMVRNAGNVTGTALATAIVTFIMVSQGLSPKLDSVAAGNAPEVLRTFVSGMRIVYIVTGGLIGLGALVSYLSKGQPRPVSDHPVKDTDPAMK
jgi:EmrB/QacA subfamily drug resistance transporter